MGNQGSMKNHLQNAERTGVFQFSNHNMSEFPKDLVKVKDNIRSLDLSHNKLRTVPSYLGTCPVLKQLNFGANRLTNLPDNLGNIKKLESLILSDNHINLLPQSFANLANLRTLVLSGNVMTTFPLQVCGLKHLELLDLSKNKIQEIPDGVENLQVSELNLNQNQVSKISESIAQCPRLKVLRLEENCLKATSIPIKLLTDSQVSLLAVDGNLFESKDFQNLEGYEKYLERYTATKKKMT